MRVRMYGVQSSIGGKWEFRYSIAWEVDREYWRRRGGVSAIKLTSLVPIGVAELACERLNAAVDDAGKDSQEAGNRMYRAVLDALRVYEYDSVEKQVAGIVTEELAGRRHGGGTSAAADGMSETAWRQLEAAARQACERLSGRSLLEHEALAALEEGAGGGALAAEPGRAGERAHSAALQLASLSGAVRLTAAVAPPAAAAPRLRGWRAPLFRLRRKSAAAAEWRCRRCGSGNETLRRTPCAACGGHACAYCEACLTMGRSRACGLLLIGAAPREAGARTMAVADPLDRWRLSPAQREAAAAALRFLAGERAPQHTRRRAFFALRTALRHAFTSLPQARRSVFTAPPHARREPAASAFLLWAVTGAGKTEMIFPLLEAVLSRGGRALVATPRRDVVLELAPRLATAFPSYSRAVLYGGSADRWANAALTLATTHQLIRFQEAFDLVLIDEMDAFPYKDDATLQFAAAKCCRPSGVTLYLSATPPASMQRDVARRRLPCARVPVRYHGHPLPVPQRIAVPPLAHWLKRRKLPGRICHRMRCSIERGAQLFVFVPAIRHVAPLVRLLRLSASRLGIREESQIEGTSSKDEHRADIISRFRERTIRLLVTTTILERGVTIPKSDVLVLDADDSLFDAASLVQMAGRAGRAVSDPRGTVGFAAGRMTLAQRSAIRQIRSMNRLAARQGYLNP